MSLWSIFQFLLESLPYDESNVMGDRGPKFRRRRIRALDFLIKTQYAIWNTRISLFLSHFTQKSLKTEAKQVREIS